MTFCPTHKMQWTDDDMIHKQHQKEFPSCNDYKNDDKLQKLQSKNSNSLSKSELKIKGKLGNLFVESVWIDEKPAFLCINLDSGEILSQSNRRKFSSGCTSGRCGECQAELLGRLDREKKGKCADL